MLDGSKLHRNLPINVSLQAGNQTEQVEKSAVRRRAAGIQTFCCYGFSCCKIVAHEGIERPVISSFVDEFSVPSRKRVYVGVCQRLTSVIEIGESSERRSQKKLMFG